MAEVTVVESSRVAGGWRYWLGLAAAVLLVKAVFYLLDPAMGYFLGDSASYIYSAVAGWIPPDRSYTYGWFIRYASLGIQSLDAMVATQVLLSAASCLILAFILTRFLAVARWLAVAAALVCALEPLQLVFERFALAETVSLFFFALFMLAILFYVQRRSLLWLTTAAVFGIAAVSLRTQYLPVAAAMGTLAAWVAVFGAGSPLSAQAAGWGRRVGLALLHTVVFLGLFFGLFALEEGKRINSDSGFMLLVAWSPLLADETFPRDQRLSSIVEATRCEFTVAQRNHQMWTPECLKARVQGAFPDYNDANAYAGGLALRLLWHDPRAVFDLALHNWRTIWGADRTLGQLQGERGLTVPPDDFVDLVKTNFGLDVSGWGERETLVGSYFDSMGLWYRGVALAPLALIAWWLLTLRRLYPANLLVTAAAVLLLVAATAPVMHELVRFYHGVAWVSLIGMAGLLDALLRIGRPHGSPGRRERSAAAPAQVAS